MELISSTTCIKLPVSDSGLLRKDPWGSRMMGPHAKEGAVERRLIGKIAVVTGSSRGIGRGIAQRLAAEGAKVVINGRHPRPLARRPRPCAPRGPRRSRSAADVGVREQVDRLFEETVAVFGGVDILVNNAAWTSQMAHFLEMDEHHWDTALRTNLKSVYLCSHRAANLMVDQERPGSIISISSFSGARAHRCLAAYDASKGGLEAFTRAIAVDLAPFGIRANVVGPGAIHTETHDQRGPRPRASGQRPFHSGGPGFRKTSRGRWPSWRRTMPVISRARCSTWMGECWPNFRSPASRPRSPAFGKGPSAASTRRAKTAAGVGLVSDCPEKDTLAIGPSQRWCPHTT